MNNVFERGLAGSKGGGENPFRVIIRRFRGVRGNRYLFSREILLFFFLYVCACMYVYVYVYVRIPRVSREEVGFFPRKPVPVFLSRHVA